MSERDPTSLDSFDSFHRMHPRLTDPTTNLRTTFMKLIARAVYEPNVEVWAEPLPHDAGARRGVS